MKINLKMRSFWGHWDHLRPCEVIVVILCPLGHWGNLRSLRQFLRTFQIIEVIWGHWDHLRSFKPFEVIETIWVHWNHLRSLRPFEVIEVSWCYLGHFKLLRSFEVIRGHKGNLIVFEVIWDVLRYIEVI